MQNRTEPDGPGRTRMDLDGLELISFFQSYRISNVERGIGLPIGGFMDQIYSA